VACFASSCTLALALGLVFFIGFIGQLIGGRWLDTATSVVLVPFILLMFAGWATFFTLVLAFVPALVIVGFAEAARVRAAPFYGVAGTTTAIVCGGYFFRREGAWFCVPGPGAGFTLDQALTAGGLVLAGLIGGLAYWSIAGVGAGDWRTPEGAQP
jgi:hypothetical protein